MDKAKKKRIKRYLAWGAAAALVIVLAAFPLIVKSSPEADGPSASVLSAEVKSGSIRQVINGGGTLASDTVDVKIPEGVRITEFLVKNGDHVAEGTPVAAVDKVSVLAAMSAVEDTLDYLREKIEDARDETVSSTIYATTGGRIKKIFANPGESVQDVMLRDGCLALLSVDGKMAVKFEVKSDAATGQAVDVTLADGSVVSGRVDSNLNGEVVVTVEDQGYVIGASVTVEGLGQGTLYVHNAWKAVGVSGTISRVSAREEKTISAGTALFALTDTEYTGQWEHRMQQHQEYEQLLQRLMQMYRSGTVDAPCDGVISGVDENSSYLLSARQDQYEVELLSGTGNAGTVRLMLLSNTSCIHATTPDTCSAESHDASCIDGCTQTAACTSARGYHRNDCPMKCKGTSSCEAREHNAGCYWLCDEASNPSRCSNAAYGPSHHKTNCIHKCTNAEEETGADKCKAGINHYLSCIESCDSARTENASCDATDAHKKTCIRSCVRADETLKCRTGTDVPHYTDCIESCTGGTACSAAKHKEGCELYGVTYTALVARVDSVGSTELVVYWDASGQAYPAERSGSGWTILGQINEDLLVTSGTVDISGTQEVFHKGDLILAITGYKNDNEVYTTVAVYETFSSGGPSGGFPGGMGGGIPGGFGGSGSYMQSAGEDEGLYDLDGETLLTVITQETMTVSISLDEQDISRISLGMEASVKIDALRGRTCTAVITAIGFTGESDGGSSKFPVELTLEADQDMLDGMRVTAQIVLETRENIPVIPLAALNGDSVNVYVYTALDKENGQPASSVTVETGISDVENVEILSGLNIGDTVYYHYYDVLELDTSA